MIRNSLAFGAVFALGVSAHGATLSSVIFEIEVSSSMGSGSWRATVPNPDISDGDFDWSLGSDIHIMDQTGTVELATLNMNGTSVNAIADPVLGLNFNVTAGGAPTSFTISSPLLSFPGIANPTAQASAGITVTDLNGNGGFLDGNLFSGGLKSFRADYNGAVPAGSLFTTLVDDASDPAAFSTTSSTEPFGPVGIVGVVGSMSTQFSFDLGSFDNAAGTSVFVVVPEPASVLLIAFGAVAVFSRRRR